MVITTRRRTIEIGIQILIGAIAWRLLFDSFFVGQENGILFSFIGGFIVFLLANGVFSLRTTVVTRNEIRKRYNVLLGLNDVSFLRRHEEPVELRESLSKILPQSIGKRFIPKGGKFEQFPSARAAISNEQFPTGLVLTDSEKRTWALRQANSREELPRAVSAE